MSEIITYSVNQFFQRLDHINDPRIGLIKKYYQDHPSLLDVAKGSQVKHQAWIGGYADHLSECLDIASALYESLSTIRPLPFDLGKAQVVLLFHDIEKLFKYGALTLSSEFNKDHYLFRCLKDEYGIAFDEAEINALHYTHGETYDYSPTERKMNPLAAFVHSVDTISARIWFDYGPAHHQSKNKPLTP